MLSDVTVRRLKQDGLKQEVLAQRATIGQSNSSIHELHHDIHDVVQSLQARSRHLRTSVALE